jgi:ribosomal protection tetracycline resistance protein
VRDLGTRAAAFVSHPDAPVVFVAERDVAALAAFLDGRTVGDDRVHAALVTLIRDGRAHPVVFGSAITGVGTDALLTALTALLPAASTDVDTPTSGTVFKIERGPAGEKLAYVRLVTGSVRVRDRLPLGGIENRVTGISVFDGGAPVRVDALRAGQIGVLRGLESARIGDAVGRRPGGAAPRQFAPPTLETVVVPGRPAARGALHAALRLLAEQDPFVDLRLDEDEIAVSLYGEVQKEVVEATLAQEFGLTVTFRETTTICIERPVGTGAAVELIDVAPNPFLVTVGLRIEPAPPGSGVAYACPSDRGRTTTRSTGGSTCCTCCAGCDVPRPGERAGISDLAEAVPSSQVSPPRRRAHCRCGVRAFSARSSRGSGQGSSGGSPPTRRRPAGTRS